MNKEKAKEISKKFPVEICLYPREAFEEQLRQFLIKWA